NKMLWFGETRGPQGTRCGTISRPDDLTARGLRRQNHRVVIYPQAFPRGSTGGGWFPPRFEAGGRRGDQAEGPRDEAERAEVQAVLHPRRGASVRRGGVGDPRRRHPELQGRRQRLRPARGGVPQLLVAV